MPGIVGHHGISYGDEFLDPRNHLTEFFLDINFSASNFESPFQGSFLPRLVDSMDQIWELDG